MPEKITIRDVALLAGVSVTTVSRALNESPPDSRISGDTIRKVQAAARRLNYRPNRYARQLVTKRDFHPSIVVMSPTPAGFGGPHNYEVVAGIVEAAAARGIDVKLRHVDFDSHGKVAVNSIGPLDDIDGIILHTWLDIEDSAVLNALLKLGKPFVLANHFVENPVIPCVGGDLFQTGINIVSHLARLGHRHLAAVLWPKFLLKTSLFLAGLRQGCAGNGLELPDDCFIYGNFAALVESDFLPLLSRSPRPTAFIAGDVIAYQIITVLEARNIRVPRDVSVLGFGNNPLYAMLQPELTTVDEHGWLIGQKALEMIADLMDVKSGAMTKAMLQFEIVDRKTCRDLKRQDSA
jgi:LacI family transcriptional regulator